jgi:selenocysteine lyase/cysteine desulfurase
MTHGPGYGDRFKPGARRFDQGAADAMIHMPMAVAAMDELLGWGVPQIGAYLSPLIDLIADHAEHRGWSVPPKAHRSPHFIGLSLPHPVASDLDARLAAEGTYLSLRDGRIRIAPHVFNRVEQVEDLFAALDRQLRKAA